MFFLYILFGIALCVLGAGLLAVMVFLARNERQKMSFHEQFRGSSFYGTGSSELKRYQSDYMSERNHILEQVREKKIPIEEGERLLDELENRPQIRSCPHCREDIHVDATVCKYCQTSLRQEDLDPRRAQGRRRLYRSRTDAIIGGVCGGIAQYGDFDPSLVRVVFAIGTLFTVILPGIMAYIIIALVVPLEQQSIDRF